MRTKPVFAIDPGDKFSAYAIYFPDTHVVYKADKVSNDRMKTILRESFELYDCDYCIEMVASYGMAVGKTVFETCVWVGHFREITEYNRKQMPFIYRKDVKMHLCGSMRAKDGNIRQAIIDQFPATGGGKKPTIGTKAQPGPLYGLSNDMWAALAVALTYAGVEK